MSRGEVVGHVDRRHEAGVVIVEVALRREAELSALHVGTPSEEYRFTDALCVVEVSNNQQIQED